MKLKSFIWVLTVAIIIGALLADAAAFHFGMSGSYKTPYYENSWFKSPYTMARLSMLRHKDQWQHNAIKTQVWLVRTVQLGDKEFWTVLERRPSNT
jgi:hypothetical protein